MAKLSRIDEVLVIQAALCEDIRVHLRQAQSLIDTILKGTDSLLMERLTDFNDRISKITVLAQQHGEYQTERLEEEARAPIPPVTDGDIAIPF